MLSSTIRRRRSRFSFSSALALAAAAVLSACDPGGVKLPPEPGPPADVLDLDLADHNACAVRTDGTVFCWGTGVSGREFMRVSLPVPVARVRVSAERGCALTAEGAAYCWHVQPLSGLSPVEAVPGGHVFRDLALGNAYTCGLRQDGRILCWGTAQLGNGGVPSPEPTEVLGGRTFAAVSGGPRLACGLTAAGEAYCWGDAPNRVLPGRTLSFIDGTDEEYCALTTAGEALCGYTLPGEREVAPGLRFEQISSSGIEDGSYCGIEAGGRALCWGDNFFGMLGVGTEANVATPTPMSGGLRWTRIRFSRQHACGMATNGGAYCWGDNRAGRLGDGTTTSRSTPARVAIPST